MTGRASRDKGNRAMRAVIGWLQNNGHPWCERRSAGQPGDDVLGAWPGVSLEIKDHNRLELAAWIDQATEQSGGRPAVVIHKRRGKSDPGSWYCTTTLADLKRLLD